MIRISKNKTVKRMSDTKSSLILISVIVFVITVIAIYGDLS